MAFCPLRVWNDQKAALAMVFMQFLYAGMALFSKAALNEGMSHLVFVTYRQATAALVLAPFAYSLERTKAPSLSFGVFCKIFLLALCGLTLSMDLYYLALRHTSAAFASTASNIVPGIIFLISIIFRIEKMDLRTLHGRLKIVGVILCVGGAMVLSLYQGPPLTFLNWQTHPAVAISIRENNPSLHGRKKNTVVEGPLLMLASFVIWSTWFVLQGEVLKDYPAKLRLTTLQCFLSSIQSGVVGLALDRNMDIWRLGWDVQLASVLYCGIFVSGLSYWLQIWCLEKKGPIYVAMFSPLSPFITVIISALIWAELLYIGSVLGGALIIGGLYCVVWGKGKEMKAKEVRDSDNEAAGGAPEEKLADV